MIHSSMFRFAALLILAAPTPLLAQTTPAQTAPAQAAPGREASAEAPQSLVLYFDTGSAAIRAGDAALLDQAARLYRDGHPIVMVLIGSTDTVGLPEANLRISQQRTASVLHGLVSRGIPAERFQLLAKGESEPVVSTAGNQAEQQNRRVEIRWR